MLPVARCTTAGSAAGVAVRCTPTGGATGTAVRAVRSVVGAYPVARCTPTGGAEAVAVREAAMVVGRLESYPLPVARSTGVGARRATTDAYVRLVASCSLTGGAAAAAVREAAVVVGRVEAYLVARCTGVVVRRATTDAYVRLIASCGLTGGAAGAVVCRYPDPGGPLLTDNRGPTHPSRRDRLPLTVTQGASPGMVFGTNGILLCACVGNDPAGPRIGWG